MRNTTLLICLFLALFPIFCQAIYHEDCLIPDFTNETINRDNLLYFSGGILFRDFRIYDMTDLSNPVMLSTTNIPCLNGTTWRMALQDNIIYTTCNSDSLYLTILDVANPMQPQILSRRCFSMDPYNLIVQGHIVYLTSHDNYLHIIDVSDLQNPIQINSIALGDSTQHIGEMKLKDHSLYIAMNTILKIYDITNAEQPAFIGEYPTTPYKYHLTIGDSKAYLSGSSSDSTGIEIIDVSNSENIHQIGTIQNVSGEIFYSDNHLYTCHDTRVSNFDVSDPNNPILLGFYENPLGLGISDVRNGYVYAQSLYNFLRINMNDPSNQVLMGKYESPIDPASVQIQGNKAIFRLHSQYDNIVGTEYSLQILDITQTNQIQHTSTISSTNYITPIKIIGQYAYVINYSNSALLIYNISDPHEPLLVHSMGILLEGAAIRRMEVVENRAYLLSMHTLYVLDIADVSNPSILGQLPQYDYNMVDLRMSDNIAYVATDDGGINLYDISNPTSISALGRFTNPVENSALRFFEMSGEIAYLAAKNNGVQVVNLQDPANPVLVQTIKPTTDICVTPIAIYNHYLFFGDDYRNIIYSYDISNPLQPVFHHSLIWNQMTDVLSSNNNRIYSISSTSINDLSLSEGFSPIQDQTIPTESMSLSNYPNPFNPETKLSFTLAKQTFVKLEVYNVRGQKIKALASESMSAGKHQISWDGKDDFGKPVASGMYFSRLETPSQKVTRKMLLLK